MLYYYVADIIIVAFNLRERFISFFNRHYIKLYSFAAMTCSRLGLDIKPIQLKNR